MDKKKITDYIQKHHMIQPGDCVIAAVSGGADSVALLLILSELSAEMDFKLTAVHVEHGIRGEESLADMHFTKELCEKLGIPIRIYRVKARTYARENGLGLEEAARKLRYKMLEEAAEMMRELPEKYDQMKDQEEENAQQPAIDNKISSFGIKIALAHHMQDQAETVLFRLARGSGMHGLSGMQPVRQSGVSEMRSERKDGILEEQSGRKDGIFEEQPERKDGIIEEQSEWKDGILEEQFGRKDGIIEKQSEQHSGSYGIKPAHQTRGSFTYIRPLLNTSRSEIEEYLAACGQDYRVDSTNLDESYARNRIRSRVLPELSEVNAQAASHIARAAEQAAEISDYIAGEAARKLRQIAIVEEDALFDRIYKMSLDIPELIELHPALQKELLRQALIRIAGHEKDITAGHIMQLLELAEKISGKEISLPYKVKAAREFDQLVLSKKTVNTLEGQLKIGAEQLEELKKTEEELKIMLSASEEVVLKICWTTEPKEADTDGENLHPDDRERTAADYHHEDRGKAFADCHHEDRGKAFTDCHHEDRGKAFADCHHEDRGKAFADCHQGDRGKAFADYHQGDNGMAKADRHHGDSRKVAQDDPHGESGKAETDCHHGDRGYSSCRKYFAYEKLKDGFTIRHRQSGDFFVMKDGHHKKLKQYLIGEKIPVSERSKLWLLAQGSQVVWLFGRREDISYRPDEDTDYIVLVEYRVR